MQSSFLGLAPQGAPFTETDTQAFLRLLHRFRRVRSSVEMAEVPRDDGTRVMVFDAPVSRLGRALFWAVEPYATGWALVDQTQGAGAAIAFGATPAHAADRGCEALREDNSEAPEVPDGSLPPPSQSLLVLRHNARRRARKALNEAPR